MATSSIPLSLPPSWETARFGGHRPKKVEHDSSYAGERPGLFSFFWQFPSIICRLRGSVLQFVLIEVAISIGLSVVALRLLPDEQIDVVGHQLVGTLLAFLVVFRSNIAWNMYFEGRAHVGELITSARVLAVMIIEDVVLGQGRSGNEFEVEEGMRLLKLFYYTIVEHVRSDGGFEVWSFAHRVAYSFATPAEVELLLAEFGPPQADGRRWPVISVDAPGQAAAFNPEARGDYRGLATTSARLENRARRSEELTRANGVHKSAAENSNATELHSPLHCRNPQDPTLAKPLVVLMWLRLVLRKLERAPREYDKQLSKLMRAYNGIDKVDKMVLPLPYAQLLKVFLLAWVFSLPFVIVEECGLLTPFVMALIAIAFFGLDQVGAELENPFGTDTNDFPLLHMGLTLMDTMDSLLRSARFSKHASVEHHERAVLSRKASSAEEALAAGAALIAADDDDSDSGWPATEATMTA